MNTADQEKAALTLTTLTATASESKTTTIQEMRKTENLYAIAIEGPADHPIKHLVQVLCCSETTGFFICLDLKSGATEKYHYQKLSLLWQNPTT